jgi:hypothetical protein
VLFPSRIFQIPCPSSGLLSTLLPAAILTLLVLVLGIRASFFPPYLLLYRRTALIGTSTPVLVLTLARHLQLARSTIRNELFAVQIEQRLRRLSPRT